MKILVVGPLPPPINGLSVATKLVVEHLQAEHDVVVVSPGDIGRKPGHSGMVSMDRIADGMAVISKALYRLVLHRPNCLYITVSQTSGGYLRDAVIIKMASLLGVGVVAHIHGGYMGEMYRRASTLVRWAMDRTLARAEAVLVLSESLREMLRGVVPDAQVFVVPNGVQVEELADLFDRRNEQERPGPLRVLYLSNMIESKGYLDVIRAAAVLRDQGSPVKVRLAGAFPTEEDAIRTKHLVETLDLGDWVEYVGVVTGPQKRDLLLWADIFALPTYYQFEGLPISTIEAMSAGLPVVVTPHRGHKDLVTDGESGLYVLPQNPEDIAAKVTLLHNSHMRVKMGQANVTRISSGYRLEHMFQRVQSILMYAGGELQREGLQTE